MPKQAVDISYKVAKKDPKPKNTYWPNTISNQDLFNSCQQEDMATIITRRRWSLLGKVLRETRSTLSRKALALFWTPEGKRKTRRPKVTWRRTVTA